MRRTTLAVPVLAVVMLAVSLAVVAAPAAAFEDDRVASNATLTSGETYCEGQRAFFGAPNRSANATYRVVAETDVGNLGPGDTAREVQLDANATAVVPTQGLEGSYVLRNEGQESVVVNESGYQTRTGNASVAAWEVLDCDFDARFREPKLVVRPGETTSVDLALTASADEDVLLRTADLRPGTVATLTGGTVVEGAVRVDASEDPTFTFPETWACRAGAYEFTVEGNSTGAETRADTRAVAAGETETKVDEDPIKIDRGGTARIPVETTCNARTTVRFGPSETGFAANATLTTDRAEDTVVLAFDTSRVGNASATAVFDGANGGTLAGANITARPPNASLPADKYAVTVTTDGEVTDEAVFRVRSDATPTPTPSPTPAATPTPSPATGPDTATAFVTSSPTPTFTRTPTPRQGAPTPSPTRSPTPAPTPSPTDSPTPAATTTAPTSSTPTPTAGAATTTGGPVTDTGGQPGFGPAATVVALVALVLVGRRWH